MPQNFKAEALARVLADAKDVKEVPGLPNTYTPDDYNALRNQTFALAELDNNGYLVPKLAPGAVEYDMKGNLKHIGRNRPAMIDLGYYTRNRYDVETIIPANEKKMGHPRGTYIVVVMGNAIVRAISDVVELPKTIKAFRFKKEIVTVPVEEEVATVTVENIDSDPEQAADSAAEAADYQVVPTEKTESKVVWVYQGAEMIPSDRAYKMTRQLSPAAMLELMQQMKEDINGSENIQGDDLESIG